MGTERLPALPPQYGDSFYKGRARARGRGRGRQEWLSERPLERSNGGFGRGFSHGNGRGTGGDTCQVTSERDQQDRWEEVWSLPTSVERREEGILIRQESPHRTPPTPTPSEDRFFTDWSSAGSPHVRTPPQSVLVAETGPNINQTVNQTIQPGSEPAQVGATRNALQDDIIVSSPRTHQQLDELGVRMIDMGTNTSDVEVRPQRDGTRVMTSGDSAQASFPLVNVILQTGVNEQVPMPHLNLSILGYEPGSLIGSHMRTQDTGIQENSMIPQLDGPASIPTRGRRRLLEDVRVAE